ncbi:hypothetical protein L9F63_023310, partial [Diploptera punctata]
KIIIAQFTNALFIIMFHHQNLKRHLIYQKKCRLLWLVAISIRRLRVAKPWCSLMTSVVEGETPVMQHGLIS